jgi:putative acetyltransferase
MAWNARPPTDADGSMSMRIRIDDLSGAAIRALLDEHLATMLSLSPRASVHALDLDGRRRADIRFWTAWCGDELLGCGALKELDPKHGEIKSMRTVTAHRRKRVARTMLEHTTHEARLRKYQRLSLETGSMSAFEPAQRLYAGFGFTYCAPFGACAADPNSVFMTKALESARAAGGPKRFSAGRKSNETPCLAG